MSMNPLARKRQIEQKRKTAKAGKPSKKAVPGQMPGPKGGPKVKRKAF